MEIFTDLLSGTAFFLWIAAIVVAVLSSPQGEADAAAPGHRLRFE
jgi:hypothetical protein